jgi:REP element-mobilizing transposase RayT
MSRKYKFHNPENAYFVSFATVQWVNLFTLEVYLEILAESLTYCRKHKGIELYAYVFMPNHVHLLFRSKENNPSGFMRDFKGFTSRKMLKEIQENPTENRKEFLLKIFEEAGSRNSNVKKYQLWQQNNHPIEVYSNWVVEQKVNYIHNNPVKKGYVTNPEEWKYSSARNYNGDQSVLEIDLMGE